MDPSERPAVHFFAALPLDRGRVLGCPRLVSLQLADVLRKLGYQIVGPDPHDLHALAMFERDRPHGGGLANGESA